MRLQMCRLRNCAVEEGGEGERGGGEKKWTGTEMHRENTASLPERNTLGHSVISIADASDRKCEWASCIQPESRHCPRTAW